MFETYTALIIKLVIEFIPYLVLALSTFIAFYILGKVLSSLILKAGKTGKIGRQNISRLLASVAKNGCITFGLLIALGTVGVDLMPIIGGLGLCGLAIGLALKDAVMNLINGILILFYQPFKQGDVIKIGNAKGIVGEINLRYIQIIDEETGDEFLVPNSQAFAKEIVKFNQHQ